MILSILKQWKYPKEWHKVITDTTLVDDPEAEYLYVLVKNSLIYNTKDLPAQGKLVFVTKAEELVDAITLANVKKQGLSISRTITNTKWTVQEITELNLTAKTDNLNR